ncbi:hypothetical protein MTO96_043142 [Rhipicephalus appendiculatus]
MCSYLMRYIASDFSEVRGKLSQCNTFDAKLDAAIDIFLMGFAGEPPSREDISRDLSTSFASLKAASAYEPTAKFSGNVLLIKASRPKDMARRLPPDYALSECCDGEVDIRVVDGTHESFILGEGARLCASIIAEYMQRWDTAGFAS